MLENIFKSINKKADEEIKKIQQDKEKAILDLEIQSQKSLREKGARERLMLQERVKKEIEDWRQNKERGVQFKIEKAKRELLNFIYQKTIERLKELSVPEFQKIIAKTAQALPKDIAGQILADQKTAPILKKFFDSPIKTSLREPGFIFQSPALEIDCRFSEVLKQQKEKIEPELNKLLFENP